MTEDLHLRFVDNVPRYANASNGSVRVSQVQIAGIVIGYLWADDAEDAAGYLPRAEAGIAAANLAQHWHLRLRERKARGLTPTQAVEEIIAEGSQREGDPGPLAIDPVPFTELKTLAGEIVFTPPSGPSARG